GSSIFLLTCLAGYNFAYRLVFLLLTIPQILDWVAETRFLAIAPLMLTIVISWESFIDAMANRWFSYPHYFGVGQVFVVLLFYCHLTVLFRFLKDTALDSGKLRLGFPIPLSPVWQGGSRKITVGHPKQRS